ncbi:MAG TPA: helix-turn-helix domain-containing protein [Streptosporangiaceae bacterium]
MTGGREGGVWESERYRPPPALRPYVRSYSGYRQAGLAPGRHRGLPSPYLTLIVTLDEPLAIVTHPDPRQPASRHDVLVGGLHTAPALITHHGHQSGIQLSVTPLGARALLGVPAGELAQIDLHGHEVLGALAGELRERVRAAATWAGRFAVLDEMLIGQVSAQRAGPMRAEVAYVWQKLLAERGEVAISGLADETGWTSRHLGARFRAETGLSPKEAARVVRFDRARRLLQRRVTAGAPPALAGLAAACGYYDQAHLAREFRGLAGCAPSRWLAEEFRNVQAAPLAAAEGSKA